MNTQHVFSAGAWTSPGCRHRIASNRSFRRHRPGTDHQWRRRLDLRRSVRQAADIDHAVRAHSASTDEVGPVQAISALIKEAAISLGLRFNLSQHDRPWYGLSEVYDRAAQEHPDLEFDGRAPSQWPDPANAWQHLQFRCSLSGASLEWCRLQALNVSPLEPAISLFELPGGKVARDQGCSAHG